MIYDYIIIGGRISGLYSAYLLNTEYNVLVLEKNNYIGGRIKDIKFHGKIIKLGAGISQEKNKNILNLLKKCKISYTIGKANKTIIGKKIDFNMIENTHAKFIHISCDIDSMDPNIMPSTGTPVNNGLLLEDVINIINKSKTKLVGFDLVEFNPQIGSRKDVNKTLNNISKIINTIYYDYNLLFLVKDIILHNILYLF